MKEIVFATNNDHKRREVELMLEGKFRILTLKEIGVTEDIPEEEPTLEGNAAAKARYVYERYDRDCFADDTGLEVRALNGAPGVHTARYAGEAKDAEQNMAKLLGALEGKTDRAAQFRTSICLIVGGKEEYFDGIAKGNITEERSGSQGFGYDPIFTPEGEQRTFAEMTDQEKNILSHRGKAVRKLIEHLRSIG